MKLINLLVTFSQSARQLADKIKSRAIVAIKDGLAEIEVDLQDVEEVRSKAMVAVHQDYYAKRDALIEERNKAQAELNAKYNLLQAKATTKFENSKASIAVKAKGKVNQLVISRASLSRELDHLTK